MLLKNLRNYKLRVSGGDKSRFKEPGTFKVLLKSYHDTKISNLIDTFYYIGR